VALLAKFSNNALTSGWRRCQQKLSPTMKYRDPRPLPEGLEPAVLPQALQDIAGCAE
jgi:hypothetical protein